MIIQTFIRIIKDKNKINKLKIIELLNDNKITKNIIIFFLSMIISIIGIIILKLDITYKIFNGKEQYIKFGIENIKDIAHIGFVFLIVIILSIKLNTKEKTIKALKYFLLGGVLSVIWGLIQLVLYALNIEYPYWIFNNSISFAQLYLSIENGMQRINSFGAEASHYAPIILAVISIMIGIVIKETNNNKISKNHILILILSLIVGIFTTSSTVYVGITIISLFTCIYVFFEKNINTCVIDRKKTIKVLTIIAIITVIMTVFIYISIKYVKNLTSNIIEIENDKKDNTKKNILQIIKDFIDTILDMTIYKFKSISTNERITQDIIGIKLVLENNIITGLGQGSFRTFDLLTNILVNSGILGVIIYINLMFVIYKEIFNHKKEDKIQFILMFNLVTSMTVAFLISIPDFIFSYYWILLLVIYNYCTKNNEKIFTQKRDDKKLKTNKVAIILLNYNGAKDTIDCIKSIRKQEKELNYEIIVVDNKSTDNSLNLLEKIKDITLIKSKDNRGFAAGNNYGIKYAIENGADYILLLNNDTEIEKNSISIMLNNYKNHKEAAIMGARIMYYHDRELINYCGGTINFKKGIAIHEYYGEKYVETNIKCVETGFITGCTMLFSKEITEKIGYLPEEYFMYYEDVDFCVRAKEKGFKLFISLDSVIYHKVSASSGGEQNPFSIKWGTRNRVLFINKFKDYTLGIDTYLFFYLTRIIKIFEYTLKGKKEERKALIDGIKEARKYLKERSLN